MKRTESAQEAVARTNAAFTERFNKGDAQGVATLYTVDGQAFPPGSDVVSGRRAIESFWTAVMDMGVAAAELVTSEVTESGDIAVETGNYRLFAADNSEIDNGKYLVVRKLEDGEWRLHRDIWNTSKAS